MSIPSTVFVDTSGLLALVNASDAYHAKAGKVEAACSLRRVQFVTSDMVLTEFLNAMASVRGRELAVQVVSAWLKSPTHRVEQTSIAQWHAALAHYSNHSDKDWSLVDCASFQLCKRRRITHVLTADHHFRQAGFHILL